MKARKPKVSIWRARAIVEHYEKREMRDSILQLPPALGEAATLLQDRARFMGMVFKDPRWDGIVLVVKHFSETWAVSSPDARLLAYTRELCAEMARHPELAPTRDNAMYALDLHIAHLYNALQHYLVKLEAFVGKNADAGRTRAAS